MKVRIEGCTAEALAAYSDYLTLGRIYEADRDGEGPWILKDDTGYPIRVRVNPETFTEFGCAHLPRGAKWVQIK